MALTPSVVLRIVSDTFTIRGIPRLSRGPRFLRGLWFCFLVSMTTGLCLTTYYLVQDYLQYQVAVNVHMALDAQSPFPALTVCHHHPFSSRAYELWRNHAVMSPTDFNRQMRNLTQRFLDENQLDAATAMYNYDSISIYYQNILPEDAFRLGHNSSIFLNCMWRNGQHMQVEDNCLNLEGIRVRRFSHHIYFNCHTFEPINDTFSNSTETLALIVSLGPKPNYDKQEQAFLVDLFEMARGLRVVVHEPGTYPNLEKEGLHVEPGKLNEINYQPVLWERLNTPPHPCRSKKQDQSVEKARIILANMTPSTDPTYAYAYMDLDVPYRYTQSQCILLHQQMDIMKKCHCQYIFNPRPAHPYHHTPYCGSILKDETSVPEDQRKNISCVQELLESDQKQAYETTVCYPRCNHYNYESTISVTTWRAVDWQLHWLRHLNRAFKRMEQERDATKEQWDRAQSKGYKDWLEYFQKENLTSIPENAIKDLNLQGNNFAYVVLKRRSGDVRVNREKLVLSISVLLSRIGGLCSLTIGLTAGFAVEIIEFAYVLCTQRESKNTNGRLDCTDRDQEYGLNCSETLLNKQTNAAPTIVSVSSGDSGGGSGGMIEVNPNMRFSFHHHSETCT
ncbi:FMRFamide-activated amiloride-sensitive sodium channel [Fasciola gigantica]|uniref:FMRFamide-activated amiloride-sensitive sodium channel n=1 Tax=Fasciola gigantica TaxID=46835 RepID=A0A504YIS5_FASGI|nr:FMRFamide-activated amiloride-sensitive sodium channel [Fasciola gigantica]